MRKNATQDSQSDSEPLLTYEELSEATKLSVRFLKKAKREMKLPAFKMGRSVRFRLSQFENWLKQYQTAG